MSLEVRHSVHTTSRSLGGGDVLQCAVVLVMEKIIGANVSSPVSSTVPSILIASIAMQESTCNPQTQGGAGEQGLMQLTQDKCGAAPNGDCKDPVSP